MDKFATLLSTEELKAHTVSLRSGSRCLTRIVRTLKLSISIRYPTSRAVEAQSQYKMIIRVDGGRSDTRGRSDSAAEVVSFCVCDDLVSD